MSDDELLEDLFTWSEARPPPSGRGLTAAATSPNVMAPSGAGAGKDTRAPALPSSSSSSAARGETLSDLVAGEELRLAAGLDSKLFPHQRDGIQWLWRKHCKARACLLADEMGLGKTVQVCAFLGALYQQKRVRASILVVPPTLLAMWESSLREWGRFDTKTIEVVHADSKARRAARWKKLSFGVPCVMLTTYGVLRQDFTLMSATLVDYVVLDEAHLIKDSSTHAFKAALTLSARHKVALTGTPLMNSFEDMWSIFKFLDGSIINMNRSDFGLVSATLLRGNERDSSGQQRAAAESSLGQLQAAIQPFMLRREKKDLDVVSSKKHDIVLWVRLSQTQENLYHAFLGTEAVREVTALADTSVDLTDDDARDDGDGPRLESSASGAARQPAPNPLVLLTALSQICNHPWLQLTDEAFRDGLALPAWTDTPCAEVGDMLSGSKLLVALELLQRCAADGRKALVFSRSKRLLSLLARLLRDRAVSHVRIDGDIASATERFKAVQAFNDDPSVMACLLTTQVGGVGLTFESASCVVLLDPSWNPSADAQAVDRVHRIGQQHGDVLVFRLVTSGTVEEKVYRNQVFKTMAAKQSTQTSVGQSNHLFRYFTRLQLRSMFEVGSLATSETATQLELLHPGRVDDCVRTFTAGIPSIIAASNNGCVLSEEIATRDSGEREESASSLDASPCNKREREARSTTPVSRPRIEKTSYDRVSSADDALLAVETSLLSPNSTCVVAATSAASTTASNRAAELSSPAEQLGRRDSSAHDDAASACASWVPRATSIGDACEGSVPTTSSPSVHPEGTEDAASVASFATCQDADSSSDTLDGDNAQH